MRLSASDSGLKRLWHWMSAYDPKRTLVKLCGYVNKCQSYEI